MERAELRVYVVEDHDDYFGLLKASLDEISAVRIVGRSYRADDAVTQIIQREPDLVLIDIQLFSGNGLDVIRAVRRRETIRQPKVIAMSTRPLCNESLQAGADLFYDKSASIDDMLKRVRALQS